jgi:hypothetical protein
MCTSYVSQAALLDSETAIALAPAKVVFQAMAPVAFEGRRSSEGGFPMADELIYDDDKLEVDEPQELCF